MAKAIALSEKLRTIFLSSVGGGLELYDFVVFAIFSSEIGACFFPNYSPLARLMGSYAVFAAGYLIRPLGGMLFSHYGDKYGRKNSFSLSISIMAIVTLLMSVVPSYASAGIVATVIFIILRLLQGISIGGEIPGAITFVSEHISERPGFACGLVICFLNIGLLLAHLVHYVLSITLNDTTMLHYGWRIAFMLGGGLAFISYYLRRSLTETESFLSLETRCDFPFLELIKSYYREVMVGTCITGLGAVLISLYFLYAIPFMHDVLGMDKTYASQVSLFQLIIFSLSSPLWSYLSDKVNRRVLLTTSSLIILITSFAFYFLLQLGLHLYAVVFVNGIIVSAFIGVFPCYLSELFPVQVRYSGIALSYNVGFALFGGLTPLLSTYFVKTLQSLYAPAFIVMFIAALAMLFLQTREAKVIDAHVHAI